MLVTVKRCEELSLRCRSETAMCTAQMRHIGKSRKRSVFNGVCPFGYTKDVLVCSKVRAKHWYDVLNKQDIADAAKVFAELCNECKVCPAKSHRIRGQSLIKHIVVCPHENKCKDVTPEMWIPLIGGLR